MWRHRDPMVMTRRDVTTQRPHGDDSSSTSPDDARARVDARELDSYSTRSSPVTHRARARARAPLHHTRQSVRSRALRRSGRFSARHRTPNAGRRRRARARRNGPIPRARRDRGRRARASVGVVVTSSRARVRFRVDENFPCFRCVIDVLARARRRSNERWWVLMRRASSRESRLASTDARDDWRRASRARANARARTRGGNSFPRLGRRARTRTRARGDGGRDARDDDFVGGGQLGARAQTGGLANEMANERRATWDSGKRDVAREREIET